MPQKILLIDNYDSFTFNLVHYIEQLGGEVTVVRNDQVDLKKVAEFEKIVLSPGPGLPSESGKMPELIARFFDKKPILGICLGMQALAEFFGGKLYNQTEVKHGVSEKITIKSSRLYEGIKGEMNVGLYHSWAVDLSTAENLIATAFSEKNVLMSFEHNQLPLAGVQYHPESVMTENGLRIIGNFLEKY